MGIIRASFSAREAVIVGWVETITAACAEVRGSRRFARLLQLVLELGNHLNAGAPPLYSDRMTAFPVYCTGARRCA